MLLKGESQKDIIKDKDPFDVLESITIKDDANAV